MTCHQVATSVSTVSHSPSRRPSRSALPLWLCRMVRRLRRLGAWALAHPLSFDFATPAPGGAP